MSPTFAERIAVDHRTAGQFVSRHYPMPLSPSQSRAYGGSTVAYAVVAACATVKSTHVMHSLLGNFLGPARTDRRLQIHVTATRDTKTFATRHVLVSQLLDNNTPRLCAELILDFHIIEPAILTFDPPPPSYAGNDADDSALALPEDTLLDNALKRGEVDEKSAKARRNLFANLNEHFEARECLGGVTGQTNLGINIQGATTQDHLSIQERSNANWFRSKLPLKSRIENLAAVAFVMDGGLGVVAMDFTKQPMSAAGAMSTMDYALRILDPDVDMSQWHLRERRAIAGRNGRTIAESRLWDRHGRLVAIESQTSILRPAQKPKI